ncbi:Putative Holin-X, holin superfamily III [Kytococcus aerolatus]|uniref:Putative Holin-X, holin superfamily III n=1 Tax=Kytococcus aerolatus TaxID=592308 RepID=A0A212U6G8_9MICO|nr:phage holin family protein [Kytococcus aerolatus]SNC73827.1 Putative Holin-X, holin superfamily III [Kytococcus aerolatus]
MATPASKTYEKTQGTKRSFATRDGERSLGEIVSGAAANAQSLVRDEIALAKAEINQDVKKGAKTGAGFGVAAFFFLYGFGLLLMAAAFGIATVLPTWAGFLIVACVLLLIAAVAAAFAAGQMKKIQGKPQRAIKAADRTKVTLKAAADPNTETPRV